MYIQGVLLRVDDGDYGASDRSAGGRRGAGIGVDGDSGVVVVLAVVAEEVC